MVLIAASTPAAAAPIVYADGSGNCDGKAPCFTTIQEAVENAGPPPMDGGAFVVVYPGTYPENVDISAMGSSLINGLPGDLILINSVAFEEISVATTAVAAAPAPPALLPLPFPPSVQAMIDRIAARGSAALRQFSFSSAPAAALNTVGPNNVNVFPAAGPAIQHSLSPFPGTFGIVGLNTTSPDSDGILLPDVDGSITFIGVVSSDNGGNGFNVACRDELTVLGVRANGNGMSGFVATDAETFTGINLETDGNQDDGTNVASELEIGLNSVDEDFFGIDPIGSFPGTQANDNGGNGFVLKSSMGGTAIGTFFFTFALRVPTAEASDNGLAGFDLAADPDEGVVAVAALANRNGVGFRINSDSGIFLFRCGANDSKTGDGFELQSLNTGAVDGPFMGISTFVSSVSANRNAGTGIFTIQPNSGIFAVNNTVIGNTDGVWLRSLGANGAGTRVEGNILCSNSNSGLRLTDDVTVSAIANWWGDASGPFHAVVNSGGLGNQVIDAGNGGGAGTAQFLPFIDTITASAGNASVGVKVNVDFQFSGGGGTVFLGDPTPFFPATEMPAFTAAEPPFMITTDNGVLESTFDTGATVRETINQTMGIARVGLRAATEGSAEVTLDGPCNLDAAITLDVQAFTGAPLLSFSGQVLLAAVLAALGLVGLRRRSVA